MYRRRLTADQARNLATLVHRQEGVLAHLTATPAVLRARLHDRGGEQVPTADDLQRILDRYSRVVDELGSHLTVIGIDTVAAPLG